MDAMTKNVKLALSLYDQTPKDTIITDADTVLADLIEQIDPQTTGCGKELLEAYLRTDSKDSFMNCFELITGVSFEEYVDRCIAQTTKAGE